MFTKGSLHSSHLYEDRDVYVGRHSHCCVCLSVTDPDLGVRSCGSVVFLKPPAVAPQC